MFEFGTKTNIKVSEAVMQYNLKFDKNPGIFIDGNIYYGNMINGMR